MACLTISLLYKLNVGLFTFHFRTILHLIVKSWLRYIIYSNVKIKCILDAIAQIKML